MRNSVGNVFGDPRAESDSKLLHDSFVETAEFRALTETNDYNFVVGRRGTGKSALFLMVARYMRRNERIVVSIAPEEYEINELRALLETITTEYGNVRSITRLVWTIHFLFVAIEEIDKHYAHLNWGEKFLSTYRKNHRGIFNFEGTGQCSQILSSAINAPDPSVTIQGKLANTFQIKKLQNLLRNELEKAKIVITILYDGLDEGWKPTAFSTAILGGLSAAVTDFSDKNLGIYGLVFIRDNMFRSLAYLDGDFSRVIEGRSCRLKWTADSLLQLCCNRIKILLDLKFEKRVKIWNRIAAKELEGREGFDYCLHNTLYRPRDILMLLNFAFNNAKRAFRNRIVESDIEESAKEISNNRYQDLLKEYDKVLPGLRSFTALFHGKNAINSINDVQSWIEDKINNGSYQEQEDSDFAVLGASKNVLGALYGVGFLGLKEDSSFVFCHDGSRSNLERSGDNILAMVHPCYWRALQIDRENIPVGNLMEIHDEYETTHSKDINDYRVKELGTIVSELPKIAVGIAAQPDFERWLLRTVKILFAGKLTDPNFSDKKHNGCSELLVVNQAKNGLWKKLRNAFGCHNVRFLAMNYNLLNSDAYQHLNSNHKRSYGKIVVIVTNSSVEGVDSKTRSWVKKVWEQEKILVLILPAIVLSRSLSKLRNVERFDYFEKAFGKRIDNLKKFAGIKDVRHFKVK